MKQNLRRKIEAVMNDDGSGTSRPLERFLFGISRCYGGILKIRENRFRSHPDRSGRLPCLVISIGNITVGGTGKTPMTLYLAELLREWKFRVAIVSRGYGGKASAAGGIVGDGKKILLDADMAGDEPVMLARNLKGVPVVIGSSRHQAGMRAIQEFAPDIILLDDGFQHRRLQRDLDILLLDAARPFGNGHLLPRGTLREPIAGMRRADVIVLTRSGDQANPQQALLQELTDRCLQGAAAGIPLFHSTHEPCLRKIIAPDPPAAIQVPESTPPALSFLKGRRVFAFSGIARNRDFHRSIRQAGGILCGTGQYPDHHQYSESDLAAIARTAEQSQAEILATTEKDYARLYSQSAWPRPLAVMGVNMLLRQEKGFQETIRKLIQGNHPGHRR